MKMNASSNKKSMRIMGFMCHSHEATAICIQNVGHKSVVVPAKKHIDDNHARFINKGKYTRLVDESRSLVAASETRKPSYSFPLCIKGKEDQEQKDKEDQEQKNSGSYSSPSSSSSSSSSSSIKRTTGDRQVYQVVVMRVAVHCQGCAGKVKRHLSKMEGVTSFSIDLETKKVTVIGKLSPVGVLQSISKVKKAEFWPS